MLLGSPFPEAHEPGRSMFLCAIANGTYALILVAVASSVPRQYTSAAFGIANMAILTVRRPFLRTFDRYPNKAGGLDVPDAGSLSVLIWAPGIALFS